MHHIFGKSDKPHTCKECSNFVKGEYHTKTLQKCKVYGLTHSEASDWVQKYQACGMFNKEWNGNRIIDLVKHNSFRKKETIIPEGQLSFEEVTNGAG